MLTIKLGEGELLRSYVKRFSWEALEVDKAEDKVQLTTFKAGLKSKEFMAAQAKTPLQSMVEMLLKAQKYTNAEDALVAIEWGMHRKRKETLKKTKKEKRENEESICPIGIHPDVITFDQRPTRMEKW